MVWKVEGFEYLDGLMGNKCQVVASVCCDLCGSLD